MYQRQITSRCQARCVSGTERGTRGAFVVTRRCRNHAASGDAARALTSHECRLARPALATPYRRVMFDSAPEGGGMVAAKGCAAMTTQPDRMRRSLQLS